MRRAFLLLTTVMALGAGGGAGEASAAEASKWCGLYCDAVYVGCRETIGHFDQEACREWHAGCLDGCKVNG